MNTYYITLSPSTGISIGFVALGETENHALAELSLSLRQANKIFDAHLSINDSSSSFYVQKKQRNVELLRTLRKPGRYAADRINFYQGHKWPKIKIKQVTRAIVAAYVNEVWLGGQ